MSLSLIQNATAIAPNLTTPFMGIGGTAPYTYSVVAGGAGGTINASTGLYTSPSSTGLDTIQVTDALNASATSEILIGNAPELFCDILQTEMNLAQGNVYLWDQKINMPTNSGLFIAVATVYCKPFGNTNRSVSSSGLNEVQSVNMSALLSVNIISRGPEARDRKEEVILALKSNYAQQQQELNSFYIAQISKSFVNLSQQDGSAIPYRFNIDCMIQYFITKTKGIPYFSSFSAASVLART